MELICDVSGNKSVMYIKGVFIKVFVLEIKFIFGLYYFFNYFNIGKYFDVIGVIDKDCFYELVIFL